jgi:hypothetical protein
MIESLTIKNLLPDPVNVGVSKGWRSGLVKYNLGQMAVSRYKTLSAQMVFAVLSGHMLDHFGEMRLPVPKLPEKLTNDGKVSFVLDGKSGDMKFARQKGFNWVSPDWTRRDVLFIDGSYNVAMLETMRKESYEKWGRFQWLSSSELMYGVQDEKHRRSINGLNKDIHMDFYRNERYYKKANEILRAFTDFEDKYDKRLLQFTKPPEKVFLMDCSPLAAINDTPVCYLPGHQKKIAAIAYIIAWFLCEREYLYGMRGMKPKPYYLIFDDLDMHFSGRNSAYLDHINSAIEDDYNGVFSDIEQVFSFTNVL